MAPSLGLLALFYNLGILVLNCGFTRYKDIERLDPTLFSLEGQLLILLWGCAYATAPPTGAIWLVFVGVKTLYTLHWIRWHRSHDGLGMMRRAYKKGGVMDAVAPLFHCVYGAGDGVFAVLFAMAWAQGFEGKS